MNAPLEHIQDSFETLGAYLRRERTLRGMSIEEIAAVTRIPLSSLHALEGGDLDELPGDVFVKGFIRAYASALELDPGPAIALFVRERGVEVQSTTLGSVRDSARGKRFAAGIAVIVLIMLFTLAISIALRPRMQRGPTDLSRSETSVTAARV